MGLTVLMMAMGEGLGHVRLKGHLVGVSNVYNLRTERTRGREASVLGLMADPWGALVISAWLAMDERRTMPPSFSR